MSNVETTTVNSQPKPLNEYEILKGKAIQLGIKDPHKIKKDTLRQLVADAEAKAQTTENGELKAAPGRPVNPNSARQQRIADLEARRQAGELKLGRPVETDSQRQQRLLERQAKIDAYNAQQVEIANGAVIAVEDLLPNPSDKLGRPIDPESPRQIAIREYEAKKAAGLIKKGRPSFASLGLEPAKSSKTKVAATPVVQNVITITDKQPVAPVGEPVEEWVDPNAVTTEAE